MDTIIKGIEVVVGLAVTGAIGAGFIWLKQKIGTAKLKKLNEELVHNQTLATEAVRYVEEKFRDIKGPDKLDAAIDWAAKVLRSKGLNISDEELEGLVLSALRKMRDAFGEEWGKAVDGEDSP
jgi:hypothetical protein